MNTTDKGVLAELKVRTDLNSKGFKTLNPDGDYLPFDLVAVTPDFNLIKIQVKYSKMKDGTAKINNFSFNGKQGKPYYKEEVDYFALYIPDFDEVFYVPFKEMQDKQRLYLRVDKKRENSNLLENFKSLPMPS